MSTGGRCIGRIPSSLFRRVGLPAIPPRSCSFHVFNKKASTHKRTTTPPAGNPLRELPGTPASFPRPLPSRGDIVPADPLHKNPNREEIPMASAQYDKLRLYIAGEWLGAEGRKTGNVVNPATGDTIGTLPHASKADLDRALDAAARGFQAWRKVSPNERAKVLRKAGELIRERADRIATLMTLEEGKTLGESKMEVLGSAEIFEWMAEECRRSYGRLIPARGAGHGQMVMREPVGPVAAFSPWNFPAVTPARKIAASLAAGSSCIIKPAEEPPPTPLPTATRPPEPALPTRP